ncbi:glycoside hydrolase family 3 N-terminal domain-containing protein [Pontibacter sp. G13]|uniref:glycoside hydrolase family 3 protein n=1 Tax=Pontibacter sp. G13 TaxID=3074898 RepID=UPI00288A1BC7|nr:glycoside hydrolase family 3 N-terminal domain-containing protein [Pontibacter sp. G13]WNJ16967.1 glycoside hydrolase family 3 N-terminal domain-containing protein [Pontibacter sp. G13]
MHTRAIAFDFDQIPDARPPFLAYSSEWAQKTLESLTPRQRIAQLLHIAAWSNRGPEHEQELLETIREYGVGGLLFFQGDPVTQARLTNTYQAASPVPLMISIDGEWGLAMRLDDTACYPHQLALGANDDLGQIYEMGRQIAQQCRRIGTHVNFAPCVDINTEPSNPVIGFRSFGSDPHQVAIRAYAYMKGMQDEGVLAIAKHFPGHGDTEADSHLTLPVLRHDRDRMEEVEWVPFKKLIQKGVGGVMTAHLHIPALDPTPNLAATLSPAISWQLLQEEMGFEGLIFTDALDMQGVAKFFKPGEVDAKALVAGNDVLLFGVDVPAAIAQIEAAIARGEISQQEIDRRVFKQLLAKAWLGLDDYQPVDLQGIQEDVGPKQAEALLDQMAPNILTPYQSPTLDAKPENATLVVLTLTDEAGGVSELAHHQLNKQAGEAAVSHPIMQAANADNVRQVITLDATMTSEEIDRQLSQIPADDQVLVGIFGLHVKARNQFGISTGFRDLVQKVTQNPNATVALFASPYSLAHLPIPPETGVLVAYQPLPAFQSAVWQAFKGAILPKGILPVKLDIGNS